ncbi:gfo/Idh/MocA family oxidoreductase [Acidaminococcus sp. AM05-11]|jgi:predicted dehydrogenase|uniref:Gfo/Idh/MocA family protein n=2 Tax=Acidaminococcus TaxID=904 RepID=UPI000E4F323B|nr:Gfo/Idh/MocA family oxidoreductase [Acidaminococcus sp. AM05-11]RHK02658.1 gfo/Idh/MocA family oxidoreductase [Acidaminococcus sp. AM05-11]
MEKELQPVVIGTVGAGYAARLHGNGYKKSGGVPFRLKTICDTVPELALKVQAEFGYEQVETSYEKMLEDPEITVVDIVTSPLLHIPMAIQAIQAGKHVICEKPLTGYFGKPGEERVGDTPKQVMYEQVLADMEKLGQVLRQSDRKFMYAENFLYAPAVRKAAEVVRAKKSKILFMKGEESLSGSSSVLSSQWSKVGGGTLIRTGTHPLSGMLWLKQQEAAARGETITVQSVSADVGQTTRCLNAYEHRHIRANPLDVEDYAAVTVTFSDGTKCLTIASDTVLGGTKNYIEVYANDAALVCNLTPTDLMNTYFLDQDGMQDVYISEMLPQAIGWNKAFVSDEVIRGYADELTRFLKAVAYNWDTSEDFAVARETMKVIYAAYLSAESGKRVDL